MRSTRNFVIDIVLICVLLAIGLCECAAHGRQRSPACSPDGPGTARQGARQALRLTSLSPPPPPSSCTADLYNFLK